MRARLSDQVQNAWASWNHGVKGSCLVLMCYSSKVQVRSDGSRPGTVAGVSVWLHGGWGRLDRRFYLSHHLWARGHWLPPGFFENIWLVVFQHGPVMTLQGVSLWTSSPWFLIGDSQGGERMRKASWLALAWLLQAAIQNILPPHLPLFGILIIPLHFKMKDVFSWLSGGEQEADGNKELLST